MSTEQWAMSGTAVEAAGGLQASRADRLAYAFYGAAAAAALVGQVWAGVEHIPWPAGGTVPGWLQVLLVAPAVAVIELGGVATSALADARRRRGERALAYRTMSALAAVVAVAFNLVGHWDTLYLAIGFAGLSAFAYALWLVHSGARRRDALRADGKLEQTAPVYGLVRWWREPAVTRLARQLALEHGYAVHESLRVAREEIRASERRKAIAACIEDLMRAGQEDPVRARIATTTYDMDRLAAAIEAEADYAGWAAALAPVLRPPGRGGRKQSTGSAKAQAPKQPDRGEADDGGGSQVARLHAVPDADDRAWIEKLNARHLEQYGKPLTRARAQEWLKQERQRGMNNGVLGDLLREVREATG